MALEDEEVIDKGDSCYLADRIAALSFIDSEGARLRRRRKSG